MEKRSKESARLPDVCDVDWGLIEIDKALELVDEIFYNCNLEDGWERNVRDHCIRLILEDQRKNIERARKELRESGFDLKPIGEEE